jgi:hypothetical protein
MAMRRFTRLTNAFPKKFQSHVHMVALYTVWYNFCRQHKAHRLSPAIAGGLTSELRDMAWIVSLIDARAVSEARPGDSRMNVKAALIIGAAIIVSVMLWIYFSPYHTCVRAEYAEGAPAPEFRCARALADR